MNIFEIDNISYTYDKKRNVIKDFSYKFEKGKALSLLKDVGLTEDHAKRRILKLSGGEQQSVAIARTLSYDSDVILADEPTGNLDGETQDAIMDIFIKLAKEQGKCIIIVTHSPAVAEKADVVFSLNKSK